MSESAPEEAVWVRPQTILPDNFDQPFGDIPANVNFATGTLTLAKVIRARAEMREGPGLKFKLKPNILQKGSEVIVLTPHKIWQKVMDPVTDSSGWVHQGTLSTAKPNKRPLALATNKIPMVFSIHEIKYAFEYPGGKKRAVRIPRGRGFPSLRIEKGRELVWIQETNSVFWLSREALR